MLTFTQKTHGKVFLGLENSCKRGFWSLIKKSFFKYFLYTSLLGTAVLSLVHIEPVITHRFKKEIFSETANPHEQIILSFNPKVGDKIDYTASSKFFLLGPLTQSLGKLKLEGYISLTEEIIEKTENSTHLKTKINDIKGTIGDSDQGIIIDTDHLPSHLEKLEHSFKACKGLCSIFYLDEQGKVVQLLNAVNQITPLSSYKSQMISDIVNASEMRVYDFPPTKVKIGDEWTKSGKLTLNNLEVEYVFNYKLIDRRNGMAYIDGVKKMEVTLTNHGKIYPFTVDLTTQDILEESTGYLIESENIGKIFLKNNEEVYLDVQTTLQGKKRHR